MTEFSTHTPGTFSWVELATTDQKAAVAFYRSLFNWDVNEQPIGPAETYSMFLLRRQGGRRRVHDAAGRAADGGAAPLEPLCHGAQRGRHREARAGTWRERLRPAV